MKTVVLVTLAMGVVVIGMAYFGYRRGRLVTLPGFGADRDVQPKRFWYGVFYQGAIGVALVVISIYRLLFPLPP